MKGMTNFLTNHGIFSLMVLVLLIPGISIAQTPAPAAPDSSVVPWLGVWRAADEPITSDIKRQSEPGVLEIRATANGKGLEITRKGAEKSVSETIFPDGFQRTNDSKNCTGTQTYNWEQQTGLLMGSSEIKCKDATAYSLSNIKMMVSPSHMTDILIIKTSGQTRIAVRHFAFEKDISSAEEESLPDQVTIAMRSALAAPWDLNKIVYLSKMVETSVLQAVLLEKDVQIRVDSKSLKQMKTANVPKDVVDLLIALALPEKFQIKKNGKVAVAAYAPTAKSTSTTYNYYGDPFYDFYGYYGPYGRAGYPWGSYWSYNSPFWWDYPIFAYPGHPGGGSGGGGGGGGGTTPSYQDGYLSSGNGYVQITPRDTGHQAVPRNGYVIPSGSYSGSVSGGGSSTYVPSSGGGSAASAPSSSGGGYSGGGSSGGGSYSAPSASPSGYSSGSGGGGGGQAVPRN
jgi:hypothetical protein